MKTAGERYLRDSLRSCRSALRASVRRPNEDEAGGSAVHRDLSLVYEKLGNYFDEFPAHAELI